MQVDAATLKTLGAALYVTRADGSLVTRRTG